MNNSFLPRLALPTSLRTAAPIVLALCIIAPLAAMAQRPTADNGIDESPRVTVKYSDLDLSRSAAVAVLLSRIQAAAKTTCSRFDSKDLGQAAAFHACISHAVEVAVTQVNQPALAALYTAKTGKKLPTSDILSAKR